MLKKLLLTLLLGSSTLCYGDIRFNELFINVPGGSDSGFEYFELLSTTGGVESLNGLTFITIDGDLGASDPLKDPGRIDEIQSLDGLSTGTNGLFLWLEDDFVLPPSTPAATEVERGSINMENDNNTYLLVKGFTGVPLETDLDTNDDGILDVALPWTEVVDVVGMNEGTDEASEIGNVFNYAEQLGGTGFINNHLTGNFPPDGFTPDAVFRPLGFETWVGMDVEVNSEFSSDEITRPNGDPLLESDFSNNIITPGAPNVTFNFSGSNSGDYNGDGTVNAADYTLWRDSLGSFRSTFLGC